MVALGSRKAVVAACRALPGTIPPQNPIENRCKALEIVGRHPQSTFPAAGALCRQSGAPQASQAGAGEGRWILSGFGRFGPVLGAHSAQLRFESHDTLGRSICRCENRWKTFYSSCITIVRRLGAAGAVKRRQSRHAVKCTGFS